MYKTSVLTAALVSVLLAAGAVNASASHFSGTLSGSNWFGTIEQCDFIIDASGYSPPAQQFLWGDTFAGTLDGTGYPCSPGEIEISDALATFSSHGSHDDMLIYPGLVFKVSPCTYTTSSVFVLHGGTVPSGPWSGTSTVSGSPFICGSATMNLSNLVYHP